MENLEQLVGIGASYNNSDKCLYEFNKNPADGASIDAYVASAYPMLDDESKVAISKQMKKTGPAMAAEQMVVGRGHYGQMVSQEVEANFDNLLTLDEDYLTEIALAVGGVIPQARVLGRALSEGKTEGARELYIEMLRNPMNPEEPNPLWKHYLENIADDDFIKGYSQKYLDYAAHNVVDQFYEGEGDQRTYNSGKAVNYIRDTVAGLDDSGKSAAYAEIGRAVSNHFVEMARQAEQAQQDA